MRFIKFVVSLLTAALLLIDCGSSRSTIDSIEYRNTHDNLNVSEGVVITRPQLVRFKSNDIIDGSVRISEPVMISQAVKEEPWGFFQFPSLGKADDGTLVVSWKMAEDSYISYGKEGTHATPMMSKNEGNTWQPLDKNYRLHTKEYNLDLRNGDYLQITTPRAKAIKEYGKFPKPVYEDKRDAFFRVDSLPEDLQGVYLWYRQKDGKDTIIHAKLYDPQLLRQSENGYMSVVWWGDMKELPNDGLVAGVYPAVYMNIFGMPTHSGVSFYQSEDKGLSWKIIGKIPFLFDGITDQLGVIRYDEPAFEVLNDGSFICVMRTGSCSPMYQSKSNDKGHTWTKPEPIAPNGVLPRLLLLKNGVLVLVSGRPGIQIRFSFDGTGEIWSAPIELVPFMNEDGSYTRDVSCGYASLIEAGDDSFYIVYSDFTKTNSEGDVRKSIWFRKVTVKRRKK